MVAWFWFWFLGSKNANLLWKVLSFHQKQKFLKPFYLGALPYNFLEFIEQFICGLILWSMPVHFISCSKFSKTLFMRMYCVLGQSGFKKGMETEGIGVTLNEPWGESGDQLLTNHSHATLGLVLPWTVSLWKNY